MKSISSSNPEEVSGNRKPPRRRHDRSSELDLENIKYFNDRLEGYQNNLGTDMVHEFKVENDPSELDIIPQPEFAGVPEYGVTLHCPVVHPIRGVELRLCEDSTITGALCMQKGNIKYYFGCNNVWKIV